MLKLAIIGADSTHTEAYGSLCKDPTAPLGKKASIHSLWWHNKTLAKKKGKYLNASIIPNNMEQSLENVDFS